MNYILNADDFGSTEAINESIVYGFTHGYLDRTTIMVNKPYFEQACTLAEQYGFKDKVGLHINITAGKPLTATSFIYSDFYSPKGVFSGNIYARRKLHFYIPKKERVMIEEEIRAQIQKYLDAGFTLRHADSHGHVHTYPSILSIVLKELKIAGFKSLRISANLTDNNLKRLWKALLNRLINRFNKKNNRQCDYFDAFSMCEKYYPQMQGEDGVCEIMLHPNIWDGDMQIGEGRHYQDLDFLRGKKNG